MHDDLLSRHRLLGHYLLPPVLLLEGGPGTGKSVLLAHVAEARALPLITATLAPGDDLDTLASKLRDACEHAGRHDLAFALCERAAAPTARMDSLRTALRNTDDGVVLVVDSAHHLDDVAVEALARFASALPGGHHLAVTTDRINGSLARLRLLTPAIVTADALRFDRRDLVALLDSRRVSLRPRQIDELLAVTSGHAQRVDVAVRMLALREPSAREELLAAFHPRNDVIRVAVDRCAGSRRHLRRVAVLRHLSRLDEDVARAARLDRSLIDRFLASGLLALDDREPRPTVVVPRTVRESLADRAVPTRTLRRIAAAGSTPAMLGTTLDLLLDLGADRLAARTLATAPVKAVTTLGVAGLARRLARIRPHVHARWARLDLLLARAERTAGQLASAAARLDNAAGHARRTIDRVALRVERVGVGVDSSGATTTSAMVVDKLGSRGGRRTPEIAPRLAELRALHAVTARDQKWAARSREQFRLAREGYLAVGDPRRAALVDLELASTVSLPRGDLDAAITELDRAVDDVPPPVLPLALALRARARSRRGRVIRARVDLERAEHLASILGFDEDLLAPVRADVASRPARRRPGRSTSTASHRVDVRVLGGLAVLVDGTEITIDDPAARALVEIIAVHGGRLHRDELTRLGTATPGTAAADEWLDTSLARVPAAIIERDDPFVGFAPDTRLDIWEFLELAREAMTAAGANTIDTTLAAMAIGIYDDVLPGRDDPVIDRVRRLVDDRARVLLTALETASDHDAEELARLTALRERLAGNTAKASSDHAAASTTSLVTDDTRGP